MRPWQAVVIALLLAAALMPAYWLATTSPPPLPVDVAPVTPIPTSTTVPPIEV